MVALAQIWRRGNNHPLEAICNDTAEDIIKYKKRNRCHKYPTRWTYANAIPEHQPWVQRTLIQLMEWDLWPLLESPNPTIKYAPPVGQPYTHNTQFAIEPLPQSKRDMNEADKLEALHRYSDLIAKQAKNAKLTIYTDASVDPSTKKATYACAVHIDNTYQQTFNIQARISDMSGSTTTELHAI